MARPNTNYESKRLELIQIAFKIFMEKGYENTTITDILRASGISKGAMYHYFDKKEDILDAVLNYIIDVDEKRYKDIVNDRKIGAIDKVIKIIKSSESEKPQEVIKAREKLSDRQISIFDYRSKELSNRRSLEMISKIIKEGAMSGEFDTIYPEEASELIISFTQSMYECISMSPSLHKINKEVDFFIFILSKSLGIKETALEEMRALLKDQLKSQFLV